MLLDVSIFKGSSFSAFRFPSRVLCQSYKYILKSANLFYVMNENAIDFHVNLLCSSTKMLLDYHTFHWFLYTLELDNYEMIEYYSFHF